MLQIIKKPPLFALEIVILEEGIFDYSTPLKNFEAVVCKAFDNAIICTQTIQQIEPSVMEKLMWSGVPNIYSVNQCEERIVALKNRIQVSIAATVCHSEYNWNVTLFDRRSFHV
jgi:hypothetical protein